MGLRVVSSTLVPLLQGFMIVQQNLSPPSPSHVQPAPSTNLLQSVRGGDPQNKWRGSCKRRGEEFHCVKVNCCVKRARDLALLWIQAPKPTKSWIHQFKTVQLFKMTILPDLSPLLFGLALLRHFPVVTLGI